MAMVVVVILMELMTTIEKMMVMMVRIVMMMVVMAMRLGGDTDGAFGKNDGVNREDGDDAHSCDGDDLSDDYFSVNEDDGEFG